jgi:hypothetical protein
MSAVGAAMAVWGGTGRISVWSHAVRGGMAGVGRRHVGMGAGTQARSEDAMAGRLRHRPHLNGAGPWVVQSRRGRGSGGLVSLVLSPCSCLASVMIVSTPLLPPTRTGRGRTTGLRRGRVSLGDKGRGGGVGVAVCHLHHL